MKSNTAQLKSLAINYIFLFSILSAAIFLPSCGSTGNEAPKSIKFKCELTKQNFLEQAEGVLLESGFKVEALNLEKGLIIAKNSKNMGGSTVELEVKSIVNESDKEVETFAKFTTNEGGKATVAYYDGEEVPQEYQEMYLQSVSLLKLLCNNPKYPNRP